MKYIKADSNVKKQYWVTAIILLTVLIPVYIVSYNVTIDNISAGIQSGVDVTMNTFDTEVENLRKIGMNITETPEYIAVNKYGSVDSPDKYVAVKNFAHKYTQLIDLSGIIKDSFIVFRHSGVIVSKKLIVCGEDYYNPDDFIRFGDVGFGEFVSGTSKAGISEIWSYCPDTEYCGSKADMLVVCLAPDKKLNTDSDAVMVSIIDINDLIEAMGIDDISKYAEYRFTSYDGTELCKTAGFDTLSTQKKITHNTNSSAIMLELKIRMEYYRSQMKLLHLIMLIYSMLIVAVGVGIVFWLRKIQSSRIHKLALAVEEFTGIENIKNDYEYITETIKGINNHSLYLDSVLTSTLIYKLFTVTLTEDEYSLIRTKYPALFDRCIIIIIKSDDIMPEIIELGAQQYGLEIITILRYYDGNIVAVIKVLDFPDYYDTVVSYMQDFVNLMKEKKLNIYMSVSSICEDITHISDKYRSAYKLLRYLEHNNIIVDNEHSVSEHSVIAESDDKLYELILSGDEFNASRLVYEQWYDLSESNFAGNGIEQMFFNQRSILIRVARKVGYTGEIVSYDSNLNIQQTAFAVTDCIKKICTYMQNAHTERKMYNEVIEYILANYTSLNFGMADVACRFDISDKTVSNIVKHKTGDSFLSFVEYLRMDNAKKLLETTNLKIAEIANMCGYGTEGAFYKAFKKNLNVSPGVYRKSRVHKYTAEQNNEN